MVMMMMMMTMMMMMCTQVTFQPSATGYSLACTFADVSLEHSVI